MRKLIAALAMALAATLVYAQNPSILRPRIEIVSASDEDSGPGLEVFYMGDEDPRMYYLSLGYLAIGSEMVQVYIDPLTELFVPLGGTVEEALARLEEIKDLFKMLKGQAADIETLVSMFYPGGDTVTARVVARKFLVSKVLEFSIPTGEEGLVRAAFVGKSDLGGLIVSLKLYRKIHPKEP